jgi:PAS domain S-box-containing protein
MFKAFFKSKLLNKVISNNTVQSSDKDEFRTVLYSIGDAVITTDLEGRIVRMNLIAEQLIEVSEAKAKGIDSKQLYSIVSEDENAKFENPVNKVLKEKQKIELSNSALLKLKNGKAIPISDSASPIINELGKMIGVVLIFRDETENRRKKKLLQESENKFSTIFHSSPEGILITSLSGEILDVNIKFLEMSGYSKVELIGKTSSDINFWKNIEDRKNFIDKILREKNTQTIEDQFRAKSGELKYCTLSTDIVELGKEKVLLSIIQDITERKKQNMKFNNELH